MKFMVGKRSIRLGSQVCLSKKGTLRICRSWQDRPIAVAGTDLCRNSFVEFVENGIIANRILYNNKRLTDVTIKYFQNNSFISEKILPKPEK